MKPRIILLLTVIALITFYTQPSFGHGVGGETLPPVLIDGKNATLSLNINPPIFDSTTGEYEILIRLYDANTQEVIPHVTYLVELSKDGKQLLRERFHDDSSNLSIKVIPKNGPIKIQGNNFGELGWMKNTDLFPLKIEGPIFLSGGLYKFHIEILTVNADSNVLKNPVKYDASISLAQKTIHQVSYEKKNYDIGVMTYYDVIQDFEFDEPSRTITFSMPYEWSQKNIEQTNVIHQELHIPKTFPELLVTRYDGLVNGIPILEHAITIDDYTTDSRIVHVVLNQKELFSMVDSIQDKSKIDFTITPSKMEKFPLNAFTHNAIFQVGLSWEPTPIMPDQNTRFFVDITRYFAPKIQEDAKFDLVIKQRGSELYRKSVTGLIGAQEKTNYYDYTFSEKNLGPVIISIEGINGEKLSSVDYVIVVSPKETKKTFPIRIPSTTQDRTQGNYFVDLTWIPENLQPGETEFIFTIYDRNLQPVPKAEYDFTILQNGQALYKNSGMAQAGGSFEDVIFFESNKGPITLQIENINQSDESIEIPIMVTPEFPLGLSLVLGTLFAIVIILYHKTGQILRHPF
ncbi:hypothetical protein [Candidatus Nitrosotenuis cloacae]|uniref:Peptidase n=1 Tax=Candidatus Nitrosotenuis cloacae TaxID=1603555 RepID=A0A3G1B4D8_9ARCH|nr:hypothetical protein [Candidatus Nitrosotenuis cloacae]AJZ76456.2 hypothetical protein SU86_008930 [Candidatus Nitrosotenuis cloacae]